jgi:hypothetical protein
MDAAWLLHSWHVLDPATRHAQGTTQRVLQYKCSLTVAFCVLLFSCLPAENLLFNRPFVFLVYDEEEQVVLFMGVVNRPTPATKK